MGKSGKCNGAVSSADSTLGEVGPAPRLPLKILMFTGPERQAKIYFGALSGRYSEVVVGWDGLGRYTFDQLTGGRVDQRVFRLPRSPRYCSLACQWLGVMGYVLRQAVRAPFDLIIGVGSQAALTFPVFRRLGAGRRFVYLAGDWFPNDRWWAFLDRVATHLTDETWNITDLVLRARCESLQLPLEKGGPTIGTLFSPPEPFARSRSLGAPYFCYVGRAWAGRGIEQALEAMRLLRQRGVALELRIVGHQHDKDRRFVENLVVAAGMGDQVRWTGQLSLKDLNELLLGSRFGLAVFPGGLSNYSNFTEPGKVSHYLQLGVPVILSKANSMAQAIGECGAGLLVDDSATDLAAAMERFCSDAEFCYQAGVQAYALAERRASPELMYQLIERACGLTAGGAKEGCGGVADRRAEPQERDGANL